MDKLWSKGFVTWYRRLIIALMLWNGISWWVGSEYHLLITPFLGIALTLYFALFKPNKFR